MTGRPRAVASHIGWSLMTTGGSASSAGARWIRAWPRRPWLAARRPRPPTRASTARVWRARVATCSAASGMASASSAMGPTSTLGRSQWRTLEMRASERVGAERRAHDESDQQGAGVVQEGAPQGRHREEQAGDEEGQAAAHQERLERRGVAARRDRREPAALPPARPGRPERRAGRARRAAGARARRAARTRWPPVPAPGRWRHRAASRNAKMSSLWISHAFSSAWPGIGLPKTTVWRSSHGATTSSPPTTTGMTRWPRRTQPSAQRGAVRMPTMTTKATASQMASWRAR